MGVWESIPGAVGLWLGESMEEGKSVSGIYLHLASSLA